MSKLSDFVGGGGLILRRQLFTASGTWTKSADLVGDQVFITAIGGGGSGNSSSNELGGCSGAYITRFPVDISGTSSESVTVGAGGLSVTGGGSTPGNPGSPSSFGSLVSVDGAVATGSYTLYSSVLQGQNPGCSKLSLLFSIPGIFGAVIAPYVGAATGGLGGSGLLLDNSGIQAGLTYFDAPGGNGYGAGGGATSESAIDSGAGAPGAVLVEWMEKV